MMLYYAGIDEAGYGPMLGPLCIGSTLFKVKDCEPAAGAPDLWSLLDDAVCRRPTDKKRRIAIDDSKTLKGARGSRAHPLRHLERGVLAFMQAGLNTLPETDEQLLQALDAGITPEPWYSGEVDLPLSGEAGEHRIAAAILDRSLEAAGIELGLMRCEVIHPHQINAASRSRERKSDLNLGAALRLAESIRIAHPEDHPRVVIDRQGGRSSYREHLALAWPDARIQVLGETGRISRYRVEGPEGLLTISFEAESEQNHLPVALASMIAKLVRELHMIRLNRFFATQIPELKPTAGYVQDGRRFMQEVGGLVKSMKLDETRLVRRV
jgi:ribonuclease HII